MTDRVLVATFTDEAAVLGATRAVREAGIVIHDVYTPYAVHGLDEAMGLRRSRLGVVCFGAGMLGLALAVFVQVWTSASDWPINVGGRPFASLPAFVPVTFELMVLFAAFITVGALFLRARLLPGRAPRVVIPRATDDRFALAIVTPETPGAEALARKICSELGADGFSFVEVRP